MIVYQLRILHPQLYEDESVSDLVSDIADPSALFLTLAGAQEAGREVAVEMADEHSGEPVTDVPMTWHSVRQGTWHYRNEAIDLELVIYETNVGS